MQCIPDAHISMQHIEQEAAAQWTTAEEYAPHLPQSVRLFYAA